MPIADEEEMEKLNDWLPPAVIVNGPEGCVVDPTGNPERVTVTEPVNPFTAATATEMFGVEFPKVVLSCAGDTERVKSATGGGGWMEVLLVSGPPPQAPN